MTQTSTIPGRSHKLSYKDFRSFIFQGKAVFTLENIESGNYIVYKVYSLKRRRGQPENTRLFNVYVRALGDGWRGNRYIGQVDRLTETLKTPFGVDTNSVGVRTFNWIIAKWRKLEKFEGKMNMYHMGVCCKCGRDLTVPESINNGIGPQCKHYREDSTIKMAKDLGIPTKGKTYEEIVVAIVEHDPSLIKEIYIPGEIRSKNEFMQTLDRCSSFGLF